MSTFRDQLLHALGDRAVRFPELQKAIVPYLIQLTVNAINERYIERGILRCLSEKYNIPEKSLDEYYSVIYTILKVHLGTLSPNVKPAKFKEILHNLSVPSDCIDALSTVVYGKKRPQLVAGLINRTKFYAHLISCKWRIDITISSSIINRVLEPHILMEWTFNNGEHQIFELSLSKFHQLRHAVATILVEMQKVEQQCASKNIV